MEPILIPVELSGGPLDGHRDAVAMPEIVGLDVILFGQSRPLRAAGSNVIHAVEKIRCAYGWANRTTGKGKRWVLEFRCVVSRWVNR